jgi:predicted nucleic acid-binding Zn ribbon protein
MTYIYECEKCKERFEVVQRVTSEPFKEHWDYINEEGNTRKCNGKVKRVITGGNGFILRGDGWTKKGKPSE